MTDPTHLHSRSPSPGQGGAYGPAGSGGAGSGAKMGSESGDLAHLLEPALREACEGRLSAISWFRSAWQAGGASTGFATLRRHDGADVEVVVKLPVGPSEFRWTTALGGCPEPGLAQPGAEPLSWATPRVLASGMELGGYDLAWLVIEKLHGSPLSAHLDESGVKDLLGAAVEWYSCAPKVRPVEEAALPQAKDWKGLIAKGREIIHNHGIALEQRWNEAIKATQRVLPRLLERWNARPLNTWCHGDLHPGNAMRRAGVDGTGGCVLIDMALVHPGHWVEDAVYLERLYWAKPELLCGVKPVSFVARLLRERGLIGGEDYTALAAIRRVLMAASVPAFLSHEGHPKYVHAALETLERQLVLVGR